MRLAFLFLLCSVLFAADGTVYKLDVGETVFTVLDTGPAGTTQTYTLPNPGSGRNLVWFDITGAYPQKGSGATCSSPCSFFLNTDLGRYTVNYEVADSTGNPLSPPVVSTLQSSLTFSPAATETSNYSMPAILLGFKDYTRYYSFAIANGVSVSSLRIWAYAQNIRRGTVSVLANGTEHIANRTTIRTLSCVGATHVCTFITQVPHGLTGKQIQITGFATIPPIDGLYTPTVTNSTTFTVTVPAVSSDRAAVSNGAWTVSETVFCTDETVWFGCFDNKITSNNVMFPVVNGEFTANATNTVGLRFKGQDALSVQTVGLQHGWYALAFNVVQPDVACTTITVSGSSATINGCTGHGYSDGDTILVQNAPGPQWRFNGMNVITSHTSSTITFTWGSNIEGGGVAGVSPYTTAAATYSVPTVQDTSVTPQPVIYVARCLIPKSQFDFTGYTTNGFATGPGNAGTGATNFTTYTLKDPSPYHGPTSTAHCSGCHFADGRDLVGFSSQSIKVASMHRGAPEDIADNIVAYIRSQGTPLIMDRPWNPPYQPCPGLDALTVAQWTAGCGVQWALTYDADMAEWWHPANDYSSWAVNGNANTRQLPVVLQMPAWRVWLPETFPGDFCVQNGCTFTSTAMWTAYAQTVALQKVPRQLASGVNNSTTTFTTSVAQSCTNNDYFLVDEGSNREFVQVTAGCGTTSLTVVRGATLRGITPSAVSHLAGVYMTDYDAAGNPPAIAGTGWAYGLAVPGMFSQQGCPDACDQGIKYIYMPENQHGYIGNNAGAYQSPATYDNPDFYGWYKWAGVKTAELFRVYQWQEMADLSIRVVRGVTSIDARSAAQYTRGQYNAFPFPTGPHKALNDAVWFGNFPGVQAQMFFNLHTAVWYHLAIILASEDRLNVAGGLIDWPYYYQFNQNLSFSRAGFLNMANVWAPVEIQSTLGNVDLYSGPGNYMSLHPVFQFGHSLDFRYVDQMTNEADKAAYVDQLLSMFATIIPFFSTGDWQTFSTNVTGCALATTPLPGTAVSGNGCYQSNVAFALNIGSYYGTNATNLGIIRDWAHDVFNNQSFQIYIDDGPSMTFTSTPRYLTCNACTGW